MLAREDWAPLARKLDWTLSYVDEAAAFPASMSGPTAIPAEHWQRFDEPYKTAFSDYVRLQDDKERAVEAVHEAFGDVTELQAQDQAWLGSVKMHAAALPLAEFAAVVGELRAARFARDGAWRTTAALGALDELRHTQIPLLIMHPLVRWDAQFDWVHRFYHTNNWVAIAARHLFDELLLGTDAVEFAVATNYVFETGFTNLQFIGLSGLSREVRDRVFETMLTSIQTDEARHAQIGRPVLEVLVEHDRAYAQYLIDKWFWRSFQLFAVLTGFSMDYLTPLEHRTTSFKEFVEEWVKGQFLASLREVGLDKPWYWETFEQSLDHFHHRTYASAYTYRASVWFDFALPGPDERAWLRAKYPKSFHHYDPIWQRISERWQHTKPDMDLSVHAMAIPTFCELCQLVLCHGSGGDNTATLLERDGQTHIFCSEPCRWIFEREPERYAAHKGLVKRVLAGEAPGNLIELLTEYCSLSFGTWGKDARAGVYPWLQRKRPGHDPGPEGD